MPRFKIVFSLIILSIFFGCSGPSSPSPTNEEVPSNVTEEIFQYEESSPDSGLLDGVNPEEIITDDWSDEGDIELDTEE